jgi:hypothetical protein
MRGKKRNLCLLGIISIDQGRATSFTQWPNWYAPISKDPLSEEPLNDNTLACISNQGKAIHVTGREGP